jgi:hypothetical protein
MTRDYYQEAREIALRLERDGGKADAESLVDAIESGATGTEILMALRWHLDRIEASNPATSPETLLRIRALRKAINAALGG